MKKHFLWLPALIMTLSFGLAACTEDVGTEDAPHIELSAATLTLDVLERTTLTASLKDSGGNALEGVIEWSSSNTSVATVDGGLVYALSAGTSEITASCGESVSTCTLTVEANGVRPQLIVGASSLDVVKGGTSKINPSVRFKSYALEDSSYGISYEYGVTQGTSASVAADGTVTALSVGESVVTVKAVWAQATAAGLDGGLTQNISVNVLPNYSLTAAFAEGYGADLYLQEAVDGQEVYRNYTQLEVASAVYNGDDISADVVYKSGDESVATVDSDGKVTVAGTASEGDAVDIWLEYATEEEGTLVSDRITLNVKKAVVKKTTAAQTVVDLSAGLNLPVEELFGSADARIVAVYDAENDLQNLYADGEITGVTYLGERKWIIAGETIAYETDVLVATKVIRTVDDLALFNIADTRGKDCFPGYYVLGNNIDASSWSHVHKNYNSSDGTGLTGTFDGRGYTVDGLALGSGGLFGAVAKSGSVINVAFTNVTINAANYGVGVMFGTGYYGKLENVYIGIKEWSTAGTGTSASLGLFFQCNDNNIFRNVVVVNSADAVYSQTVSSNGQYGTLVAATNKGAWENVFVVSGLRLFGSTSGGEGGDAGNTYCKSVQRFGSMAELLSDSYYTDCVKTFGDMWDRNTMTFVSSSEIMESELSALPSELDVAVGTSVAVTPNWGAYDIALSDGADEAGVVFANGKISSAEFTDADGLTLTVSFGDISKAIKVNVINSVTLENFSYVYNKQDGGDLEINGAFPEADTATVKISGTDGQEIILNAAVNGDTLTIPSSAFSSEYMPSGEAEMTAVIGGATVSIIGVKLIYAVNTADEFMTMSSHMTLSSDGRYYGSILIAADLDFTGKSFASAAYPMYRQSFAGEIDGGLHVLSNIAMTGSATGAFCGTLYGTVENVVIKNSSVSSYGGIICYENFGTIRNCYAKGSVNGDGTSAASNFDNFGTGLLAGKNRNGSKVTGCIVEILSRKDVLYTAAAFGKLGDGSANEASIFENCYAVAAGGFALMTYGGTRTVKDFNDANGNKNFSDIFALFNDDTASALALSLGLSCPEADRIVLSSSELSLLVGNNATLTATVYTADGEAIAVAFGWSATDTDILTVENGVVTALQAGEATVNVNYGQLTASCTVTVTQPSLPNLVLTDFSYAYNGSQDFTVTGDFPAASEITAKITGTDGSAVELSSITVEGNTLTIPAAQFNSDKLPTKSVSMSLYFDGNEMIVEGCYLIYTVNTLTELQNMKNHMTEIGTSSYDGHIILGADIEETLSIPYAWAFRTLTYNGIFDGNYKHLQNVTVGGAGCGLFGTLGANGVIKNVIVDSATISSYAGALCYSNSGTIENCYVKGSITKDGLTTVNINCGAGLIAGKNLVGSHVRNCIAEVVSRGVLNGEEGTVAIYMGAAFGEIYGGSAKEASIFENCYAVNAEKFTLKPYSTDADFKNFDDANGNKNFNTLSDLFADETASALAVGLGIANPAGDGQ